MTPSAPPRTTGSSVLLIALVVAVLIGLGSFMGDDSPSPPLPATQPRAKDTKRPLHFIVETNNVAPKIEVQTTGNVELEHTYPLYLHHLSSSKGYFYEIGVYDSKTPMSITVSVTANESAAKASSWVTCKLYVGMSSKAYSVGKATVKRGTGYRTATATCRYPRPTKN